MPCRETLELTTNTMSTDLGDFLCPDRLRDEMTQGENSLLLIDCRPQAEFSRAHVRGAINISLPSLMLKRLRRGNLSLASVVQSMEAKERLSGPRRANKVVLYDDCSTDLNSNPSAVINLLVQRLRLDGCKASFLLGGFSTFEERFPEFCQSPDTHESNIVGLCNLRISPAASTCTNSTTTTTCNNSNNTSSSTSTTTGSSCTSPIACPYPVEVLPNLFLGSAKNSADLAQLRHYRITHILNVTANVPNMFENEPEFKYLQIPISDHWSQNLAAFFPEAIRFIDEARLKDQGVLVHCLAGISRSVTVTLAYLMARQKLSLNRAYEHVKRCKPNISPNFTFMGQLLEFQKSLDEEPSSGEDEGVSSLSPSSSSSGSDASDVSPV